MTPPSPNEVLLAAVYQRRLPTVAAEIAASDDHDAAAQRAARRAVDACARIGAAADDVATLVLDRLAACGLDARRVGPPGPGQNVEVVIDVGDPTAADRGAEALASLGFEPWDRWRGAALRSFHRHGHERTVASTGEHSSVVRLRWREQPGRSSVARAITPTPGDWSWITLPEWAWWAYPAIRAARLVAERTGRRARHADLGPFLATPESLIEPLLAAADVTADDVVVDLGCGDGRIVVGAAVHRRCRAVGVEASAELVDRARRRVEALPDRVADMVTIRCADAREADLGAASVALLFLPLDVVGGLLPGLLERMPDGSRLVVHEQTPFPEWIEPQPDTSELVVGDDAVTVAHRWNVSRRPATGR